MNCHHTIPAKECPICFPTEDNLFDAIKLIQRLCTCGKSIMKWYNFEYASDLMAFIEGEAVFSECCPEDDDE